MAERLIGRGVQGSRVQKFNQIRFDASGYSFLRPIVVFWASLKNNIKVRDVRLSQQRYGYWPRSCRCN